MRTVAMLVNTHKQAWLLTDARTGNLLTALEGEQHPVLGSAEASLIATHGYPQGTWVCRGPGRHAYQVEAPEAPSS